MRFVSRLANGFGARAWFVTGFAVLAVGVLGIVNGGPRVLPCLAFSCAGLAFQCAMFLYQNQRRRPPGPWLRIERPRKRQ